jgi:pimeloyl-ACP methyl ester carboxylesterase
VIDMENHKSDKILLIISVAGLLLSAGLTSFGQVYSSGYMAMGDDSIFYEAKGSGEVIILIHDGILNREVWDDQFAYFAERYKVIRYDRRGYGKSSPARGSYSHLEDLKTLYECLNIDRATLMACSSGGALAIDLALSCPKKVRRLVLVGAIVGGFTYTNHFYTRGGYVPESFENDLAEGIWYVTKDPYAIYTENTEAKTKAVSLLENNPTRIYSRSRFIRGDKPAYRRLNEIQIPALILVGEFDMPDVHAHAGAMNAGIFNSKRIIISNSGHLIPMEQPALFNKAVSDFMNAGSE